MSQLTNVLTFQGKKFYFTGIKGSGRVYKLVNGNIHYPIVTDLIDHNGALMGRVCETFREGDNDNMIRYFDSVTGNEKLNVKY
ncbi:hypothetical protein [Paenibacillus lautus]|uniref:hypothetical protein n=1 Tax=Paenibacillus lautus TaxID=1401 RepID=UPI001C7D9D49|nr:hypothetical protein [Paenibacillus lautus]MBX4152326.1 hypothetical protein [Paenibacillus lautus]